MDEKCSILNMSEVIDYSLFARLCVWTLNVIVTCPGYTQDGSLILVGRPLLKCSGSCEVLLSSRIVNTFTRLIVQNTHNHVTKVKFIFLKVHISGIWFKYHTT